MNTEVKFGCCRASFVQNHYYSMRNSNMWFQLINQRSVRFGVYTHSVCVHLEYMYRRLAVFVVLATLLHGEPASSEKFPRGFVGRLSSRQEVRLKDSANKSKRIVGPKHTRESFHPFARMSDGQTRHANIWWKKIRTLTHENLHTCVTGYVCVDTHLTFAYLHSPSLIFEW